MTRLLFRKYGSFLCIIILLLLGVGLLWNDIRKSEQQISIEPSLLKSKRIYKRDLKDEPWTEKKPFGFSLDEIVDFRFTQESCIVDFSRYGKGWHMRKPKDEMIENEEGSFLLKPLLNDLNLIWEKEDMHSLKLMKKLAQFEIGSKSIFEDSTNLQTVLTLYKDSAGKNYLHREMDGRLAVIGPPFAEGFLKKYQKLCRK